MQIEIMACAIFKIPVWKHNFAKAVELWVKLYTLK